MKLNVIRILVILAKTTQSKAKLAENAKLSRQTVTNVLKTGGVQTRNSRENCESTRR